MTLSPVCPITVASFQLVPEVDKIRAGTEEEFSRRTWRT